MDIEKVCSAGIHLVGQASKATQLYFRSYNCFFLKAQRSQKEIYLFIHLSPHSFIQFIQDGL